jgi:aryl-alcohol dehydrogenase-like predicted oxidoreductase
MSRAGSAGRARRVGSQAPTRPAHHRRPRYPGTARRHQRTRTRTRTIEAAVLPTAQRYGMGVITYGPLSSGWLSGRADPSRGHRSSGAGAKDFDLSVPANRAKLTAVEQLTKLAADTGLPLAHLATAFVLAHPAVTSVLTGPRTMDHLTAALAGADARLDQDVLDKIDEIVAPGAEVNPADNYITDEDVLHPRVGVSARGSPDLPAARRVSSTARTPAYQARRKPGSVGEGDSRQ